MTRSTKQSLQVLVSTTLMITVTLSGCSDQVVLTTQNNETADTVAENPDLLVDTSRDNDDYWAALAQSYESFDTSNMLDFAFNLDISTRGTHGEWGPVRDWPLIATAAANLADGRIVAWASTGVSSFGGGVGTTFSTIYDPQSDNFTSINNADHDMFCAGVSMLPDGRVFSAAGGATVKDVSIFDLDQEEWVSSDPMIFSRWYPTSTTLPSGQVFSALGTKNTSAPELWTEGSGWKLSPGSSMQDVLSRPDTDLGTTDWYPMLYVAPNGTLFHPGPTRDMLSFNPGQAQGISHHGARESVADNRLYGASVMYDVGKMLLAGGGVPAVASALTIDVNGSSPLVSATNPPNHARTFPNTLVMPDGKVLMIGGTSAAIKFSDEGTILVPEMWDPDTGVWIELSPHAKPRNYHSTALLLKDGRVIAAGGGLCGGCATNHQNAEIYSPPYLFDSNGELASRPVISGGTAVASAGGTLNLTGSNNITEFNMIRLTGTTHHTNTDQRFIKLDSQSTGNRTYAAQLPDNPNVLIPGLYWVFGLNSDGVPSHGHTVEISVSSPTVNDSSHIARENLNRVQFEYYEGEWDALPNFDALTPVKSGMDTAISLEQSEQGDNYALRFTAKIEAPASGDYTFFLTSDDGSALYINGALVINHDGIHREVEQSATVNLGAGVYEIVVEYFENSSKQGLSVEWSGSHSARQSLQTAFVPFNTPIGEGTATAPVRYEFYEGTWNSMPNFDALTAISDGYQDALFLPPVSRADNYGLRLSTSINLPTSGNYTFYVGSDDGSRLYIDNDLIVDNDGVHRLIVEENSVNLAAGNHSLVLEYFENAGAARLFVDIEGPGIERQLITPFISGGN